MSDKFEFIGADDRPALLAFSTPDWLDAARLAALELGYKVHTAATHSDFLIRFSQFRYEVVIVEELFAANSMAENATLATLQSMPMNQRRHAAIILFGTSFQTFTPMQAFQQSVHAVVNREELALLGPNILGPIVQRVVADNDLFLNVYRDSQLRMAQGKV